MKYVLSFLGLAHLRIYTKPLQNGRFVQLFYVVICRKKIPLPERQRGFYAGCLVDNWPIKMSVGVTPTDIYPFMNLRESPSGVSAKM